MCTAGTCVAPGAGSDCYAYCEDDNDCQSARCGVCHFPGVCVPGGGEGEKAKKFLLSFINLFKQNATPDVPPTTIVIESPTVKIVLIMNVYPNADNHVNTMINANSVANFAGQAFV